MQSRLAPNSVIVSGPTRSCDEDNHLTIKKLRTQELQSSGSHALAPSTPHPIQVQTVISTSLTQTQIVHLKESDDEQGVYTLMFLTYWLILLSAQSSLPLLPLF